LGDDIYPNMRLDGEWDSAYGWVVEIKDTSNQLNRKATAMNLSDFPPFDESVVGRALTPGPIGFGTILGARSRPVLVQSNMRTQWTAQVPDSQALRRNAEFTRTAYLRNKLELLWTALENWFAYQRERELEDYLADSQNLADLETRMRHYSIKRNAFGLNTPNFE
jgi:hypothetical protein